MPPSIEDRSSVLLIRLALRFLGLTGTSESSLATAGASTNIPQQYLGPNLENYLGLSIQTSIYMYMCVHIHIYIHSIIPLYTFM